MRVICEDEEHHEKVLISNTVVVVDEEEDRPKRVCGECKEKYSSN